MDNSHHNSNIPVGLDYLHAIEASQVLCRVQFDQLAGTTEGIKVPKILDNLGVAFAYLSMLVTGFLPCTGVDEKKKNIIARAISNAQAALCLLRLGFYDEGYSLIRQVGEAANLVALFCLKPEVSNDTLKPCCVRNMLKDIVNSIVIPMNAEEYHRLSGLFTHPGLTVVPQDFSVENPPRLSNRFQPEAVKAGLNDLGRLTALLLAYAVMLLQPSKTHEDRAFGIISNLVDSLGNESLKELRKQLKKARRK